MNGYLGGRATQWLKLTLALTDLFAEHDPLHADAWRVEVTDSGDVYAIHAAYDGDERFKVEL